MSHILLVLVFLVSARIVVGFSSGAPSSACELMTPGHGFEPQESESPVLISFDKSVVNVGESVTIKVESADGTPFKGVLVQARKSRDVYETFGFFSTGASEDVLRVTDCMTVGDAITHASSAEKLSVEFNWTPAEGDSGILYFIVSVALQREVYWVKIVSDPIQVEDTTEPNHPFYESCGEDKFCFGIPNDCHITQSCEAALSTRRNNENDTFFFELISFHADALYAALAISDVDQMSPALVLECIRNQNVEIYASLMSGSPRAVDRSAVSQDLIKFIDGASEESYFYCLIETPAQFSVQELVYDLIENDYHLLMAYGSNIGENGIGYHNLGRVASEKLKLGEIPNTSTPPTEESHPFYEACGKDKFCFGIPNNCLTTKSCETALSSRQNDGNGTFFFEVISFHEDALYAALAISDVDQMSPALVLECIRNQNVEIYASLMSGAPRAVDRSAVSQDLVKLIAGASDESYFYCLIETPAQFSVQELDYDLIEIEYHMLLAYGSNVNENGIGYHNLGRDACEKLFLGVVPPITTPPTGESHPFYDSCGEDKACFGIPEDCHLSKTCETALSTKQNEANGTFFFELISFHEEALYTALAISDVDRMSPAFVLECIRNQNVEIYASLMSGSPRGVDRSAVDQDLITFIDGASEDFYFYCLIEVPAQFSIAEKIYDLDENEYHLLIAHGSNVNDNGIGFHDLGRAATGKRKLGETGNFSRTPLTMFKLHGIFMIIAWLGCASIGTVFARYFKKSINGQACGKDVWFIAHISFMTTSWALTIIAIILIFVQIGEWLDIENPHPILGLVTSILAFIQPIGALFRPHPKAPFRPLFNLLHGSNGYITHILAFITMFYATSLPKLGLPDYLIYILTAYLIYYLVVQMLMTTLSITDYEKQPMVETPLQTLTKKSLLVFHIGITTAIVVAVAIIIGIE